MKIFADRPATAKVSRLWPLLWGCALLISIGEESASLFAAAEDSVFI